MEKLKLRHTYLLQALDALEKSLSSFQTSVQQKESLSYIDSEELIVSFRDSTIKRFEFTIELFWKYIKKYLESLGHVDVNSPKQVVRQACKANLISIEDAEKILEMLDSRNLTSHIYKEEIADKIASMLPNFYDLMKTYAEKLIPEKSL